MPEKTAAQKALDEIVNRKRCPDVPLLLDVVDEIDSGKATKAQLSGLITAMSMLLRQYEKRLSR